VQPWHIKKTFEERGLTYREGFERATTTWDCRPAVHYSEPARLHGADASPQAHADYVAQVPDWLRARADVIVEAGRDGTGTFSTPREPVSPAQAWSVSGCSCGRANSGGCTHLGVCCYSRIVRSVWSVSAVVTPSASLTIHRTNRA